MAASRSAAAASPTALVLVPTAMATPRVRPSERSARSSRRCSRRWPPCRSSTHGRACWACRATGASRFGADRATGIASAGGYVGEGVAASNLAGRTLADLVLERDSALTAAALGRAPRPALGARAAALGDDPGRLRLYRRADAAEAASGRPRGSRRSSTVPPAASDGSHRPVLETLIYWSQRGRDDHAEPSRAPEHDRAADARGAGAGVAACQRENEVKVIVLRGAGRSFCAGFDFADGFHHWDQELTTDGRWDPGKDFAAAARAGVVPRFMSIWRSRSRSSHRCTVGASAAAATSRSAPIS